VSKPVLDVALALLHRDGRWLVARRFAQAHLGGMWEFPGGKREPGESPGRAAVRELLEECGVDAAAERTMRSVTCEYEDRVVNLTPVICRWRAGEPHPIGNEECRWVSADELGRLEMPAVNEMILRELPRVD